MNHQTLRTTALTAMGVVTMMCTAHTALNLEGQSGVFLNPLAYTLQQGKTEISSHHVSLDTLGSVSTFNLTSGLRRNVEIGVTQVSSSVDGVRDQSILLAKWQFAPETETSPAVAAWVINRNLSGGGNSTDFGLSATKALTAGKFPVVVDLGVRSTKALGLGLFGFAGDGKLKWEGSAAVFLSRKIVAGTEFKQQIGADTWTDIAFRYIASDSLNIDAGIADLGPGLGNQVALAATWSW